MRCKRCTRAVSVCPSVRQVSVGFVAVQQLWSSACMLSVLIVWRLLGTFTVLRVSSVTMSGAVESLVTFCDVMEVLSYV